MVSARHSEKLDLRLTAKNNQLLTAAAAAEHYALSEFVVRSALAQAREILADRQHFGLDAEQWAAFITVLDAPTRDLPRTQRLLREPSVFETGKER